LENAQTPSNIPEISCNKFKKGQDEINFHAREFVRELDKLAGDGLFDEGVELGKNLGKLYVEPGSPFSAKINESFYEKIPDHRILATADYVREQNPKKKVILVTKDINLRMKAKSLGIPSEDYRNDKVQNMDIMHQGITSVEGVSDELIGKMYAKNFEGIPVDEFELNTQLVPNDYFIFKGSRSSVIAYFNPFENIFERVYKERIYGIDPRNSEQTFAMHALLNPDIPLVAITGKAGTGKTLLALASALEQEEHYHQVLLARPIVALSNKDLGYLPGSETEKIKPYMQPLFDNLTVIKQGFKNHGDEVDRIDEMLNNDELIISPLAYIRGRSLSKVYFIIDEAQNLTPHEVKTIITRAGEGTKIVFTGDIEQIDSPYLDSMSNGLTHLTDRMKGQKVFTHINLVKGERSELAELASNLL